MLSPILQKYAKQSPPLLRLLTRRYVRKSAIEIIG